MKCYRSGGCGPYEMLSCTECPASKKEYILKDKHIDIYVATLNGNIKDNFVAIGLSKTIAEQNIVDAYFGDKSHTVLDLGKDLYITTLAFTDGKTVIIE